MTSKKIPITSLCLECVASCRKDPILRYALAGRPSPSTSRLLVRGKVNQKGRSLCEQVQYIGRVGPDLTYTYFLVCVIEPVRSTATRSFVNEVEVCNILKVCPLNSNIAIIFLVPCSPSYET